ncbi:MAG: hypothetical protein J6Z43_02910 [Clostridiales bacterium]|nr:hypothetical protein [Clostridiales bacterium]
MSQVIDGGAAARTVIRRMYFSVVAWFIIAGFQILFGIPLTLFGYGVSMILCGGWNIYASISRIKTINAFKAQPQLIFPYYENSLNNMLIFLIINVIFGGVIGVFASLYDLLLRHYVMTHKEELTYGLLRDIG